MRRFLVSGDAAALEMKPCNSCGKRISCRANASESDGYSRIKSVKKLNFKAFIYIWVEYRVFFAKRIKAQADLQFVKIFGD